MPPDPVVHAATLTDSSHPTDLYVYYRVDCAHADLLHESVTTVQAELAHRCKITTALKRRPEPKDGRHTWMETYLNIPAGFDAILSQAISQSPVAALIDGERHAEYFLDITTCA